MHSPEEKEKELKHLLTAQPFDTPQGQDEVLKRRIRQAEAYVELENASPSSPTSCTAKGTSSRAASAGSSASRKAP